MRMMPALCAVAVSVGLGGCATVPDLMSRDGVLCGLDAATEHVFIDIRYASDGMPAATPDSCTVSSGTHVTWRTQDGDGRPFKLVFKTGTPDDGAAMLGRGVAFERGAQFSSASEGGRQKVKIKAKAVTATISLKYDIEANGKKLDPDVIIKPR